MIGPYKITWAGLSSLDLDLWTELSLGDGDNGATSSFLNKESIATEYYDGSYKRIHSYKYNEVLTPRITFVKQNYEDFTPEENRKILSWLTSKQVADYLEIYHDDSNVVSYRLFGNFTTVEQHKITNGRVIGYECEFESSSPYAWSQKFELVKQISNPTTFKITSESDEYEKLVYPKISIKFNGGVALPMDDTMHKEMSEKGNAYEMLPNTIYSYNNGTNEVYYINIKTDDDSYRGTITTPGSVEPNKFLYENGPYYYYFVNDKVIKKVSEDNGAYVWKTVCSLGAGAIIENTYSFKGINPPKQIMTIRGAANTIGNPETIVFDGSNKVIYNDNSTTTKIMGNNFNWEWIGLAPGINNIKIIGDCEVKFEWVEPRKVGSL